VKGTFGIALAAVACGACSLLLDTGDTTGGPNDAGGADTSPAGDAGAESSTPADPYAAVVLGDAPLAYFRFDDSGTGSCRNEVAGSTVTCAYPAVGTVMRPGISGTSVCFTNLTSVVAMIGAFEFTGDAEFTLETWVKLDAVEDARLFTHMRDPSFARTGTWLLTTPDGDLFSETWVSGTHIMYTQKAAALSVGKFFHVVLSHTDRDYLYLDTAPGEGNVINTSAKRTSAGVPFEWGRFLGCLDEVAVYAKALPVARIGAHFAARPM
jgi:hypothetical protein